MPSTREFRRRIRSVKNTSQITRAMEMVSAVKMRRAQEAVGASRPYAEKMAELVGGLVRVTANEDETDPLLTQRPVNRVGLIVITGDRGLCGALNTNVIRRAARFIVDQTAPVQTMAIGKKGRDWLLRHSGDLISEVSGLPERPTLLQVAPITTLAIDGYREGRFDRVDVIYSRFVTTTRQEPAQQQILPVVPPESASRPVDFIFEPDPATVLSKLLPRYVEVEVYQAVLETAASEHSARMIAMHNATQNAREVVRELTLSYNKARQDSITKEILEIAAGAEALKAS
ncbi:MAG: ATP synthase F1 subunit gamma [Chloroflexota bacterium]